MTFIGLFFKINDRVCLLTNFYFKKQVEIPKSSKVETLWFLYLKKTSIVKKIEYLKKKIIRNYTRF